MEIDAPIRLENTLHLQESRRHHREIGLHPLAVSAARCVQYVRYRGVFVGNQPHPCNVKVTERPRILERRACRLAPYGSFIVAVRVERRVEVDKVNRLRVHPTKDVEVVSRPDRLIDKVRGGHNSSSLIDDVGTGRLGRYQVPVA